MESSALFELERVSLGRGGEQVLTELSARLPEGVSAIVGPSGAGKSTVLRLFDRLSDADTGTVRFRGEDTRDLDPLRLRREVALVPQLPVLLEGTVADNLRFAAGLRGAEPDIGRLLGLGGLDESFADRDVERLSVGEQQRAMIARALATEPDVLLLDEPTSALDEEARDSVERTVAELRERVGASVVLVTHDPAQARRLADWVVRLEDGRLVREGPAMELLA
ncbi:MAG TPA: ATP-binding cassette domain-containing protein [Solirubrobacterales bacterium]|jgi:putative ABC transport system ATP-binding protein|nr:ATP-binding cassette domain-containing protein [Solirubrobacterales bacterium]